VAVGCRNALRGAGGAVGAGLGRGDFAGGKAAQRVSALTVTFVSKTVALPLLVCYLVLLSAPLHSETLAWGASAGAFGMVGMVLFYRALAAGAMSVVAPVTAVTSAAIPVVVGLAAGERPGSPGLTGVACALVAIALVSLAPSHPRHPTVVTPALLGLAVGAGVGFGLFFVFLARAGDAAHGNSGLWPIAASQCAALLIGAILMLLARPERWPRGRSLGWSCIAGPFDLSANALYLVATRHGDLSVVAPLAALYPVTTVVLALLVDRERLRLVQIAGLILAVAALVLVNT
jgi:drug/metabolite transporter (DMT)-like permease